MGGAVTHAVAFRTAAARHSFGRWQSSALLYVPALVLLVPVFVIPTVSLLALSFGGPSGAFGNYADMMASPLARTVFLRSFRVAATVTAISVLIGVPFVMVAYRAGPRLRATLLGVVVASLFFSVIVRAYAWLAILGHEGPVVGVLGWLGMNTDGLSLSRSGFAVTVGLVQYGAPFMVLAIWDVLRRVDTELDRAAATLGAGPVVRFRRVTFPLIAPGIIAGSTIVFTTTLGYFVIPAILGSPRNQMIGELISAQVGRTMNWGLGAALATTLLVVSLAIVVVFRGLTDRIGKV
ncbi:ABC transporter permease [Mycolicibacterium sp. BiH015]|uniref:ABC transporter permease n=1 Tax=Mycolicibacterium sp. BiH015 TaxID=3018808 RepID=UPI0022E7ED9E|nr:ABC transporter permease [Mycolicibacterium sp. BiH015]MDA2893311.1 ABC transporter permease [Mycolicibacterium sp. BiH015]